MAFPIYVDCGLKVAEIFVPLAAGARVLMVPADTARDAAGLAGLVDAEAASVRAQRFRARSVARDVGAAFSMAALGPIWWAAFLQLSCRFRRCDAAFSDSFYRDATATTTSLARRFTASRLCEVVKTLLDVQRSDRALFGASRRFDTPSARRLFSRPFATPRYASCAAWAAEVTAAVQVTAAERMPGLFLRSFRALRLATWYYPVEARLAG